MKKIANNEDILITNGTFDTDKDWSISFNMNSYYNRDYTINGISIIQVDSEPYFKEKPIAKPPHGRSVKQHNLIVSMNKKSKKY